MNVEQLRWLLAIPCLKPIHLPPTHFAFLEEGVFLPKMINYNYQTPTMKFSRIKKLKQFDVAIWLYKNKLTTV